MQFVIRVHQCLSVGNYSSLCLRVSVANILRPQERKDRQGGLLRALAAFSGGADAGRTAVFAWACGDQFARLGEKQLMRAEKRLGKTDPAGVGVVKIQIRLEEFFLG